VCVCVCVCVCVYLCVRDTFNTHFCDEGVVWPEVGESVKVV